LYNSKTDKHRRGWASFVLAYRTVKHNEPFSEAEFLKDCMLDAVDIKTNIEGISLSRRTIVRPFCTCIVCGNKSIQMKLALSSKQLREQNFAYFPLLQTQAVTQVCSEKYSQQVSALKDEFSRRFADFHFFSLWKISSIAELPCLPLMLKQYRMICSWN